MHSIIWGSGSKPHRGQGLGFRACQYLSKQSTHERPHHGHHGMKDQCPMSASFAVSTTSAPHPP